MFELGVCRLAAKPRIVQSYPNRMGEKYFLIALPIYLKKKWIESGICHDQAVSKLLLLKLLRWDHR